MLKNKAKIKKSLTISEKKGIIIKEINSALVQ